MPTLSSSSTFLVVVLLVILLTPPTRSRKLLQDPFFPGSQSSPPAIPPAAPFTKYPFTSDAPPFFPQFASPPPPLSSTTQPTFPANLTSLVFPNSPSSPRRRPSSSSSSAKLAVAVLLPLLAFSILSLSLAFFLLRRRSRRAAHSPLPEKTHFFPPNYSSSSSSSSSSDGAAASVSPELRPLPPLTRQVYLNNADGRCSSPSDEFYSPRNSSLGRSSSPQKDFPPPAMAACGSVNDETLSTTPSYPSSSSDTRSPPALSPPMGWSPENPTAAKSVTSRSSSGGSPAISPPSPITSPLEKKPDPDASEATVPSQKEKIPSFENLPSREMNGEEDEGKPLRATPPPPPPPPPPPRAGYWESKIRRSLIPANQTESTVADSENQEKNEETPRPKLKPLHWDKVRASSDRAMVWDQLKSSSFQ